MSDQSFDPNRTGLPIEHLGCKESVSDEKSKILDIGCLVLQLAELHKLGLRALQLASLVCHLTDLAKNLAAESDEKNILVKYCHTDGIESMRAAHDIMLMMQLCVEGIRDAYARHNISSDKEVALSAAATSEFVSSLYQIVSSTLTRISELPEEEREMRMNSSRKLEPGSLESTVSEAISVGRRSLKELERASAEFKAVRDNIAEWAGKSDITKHAGGLIHFYWPPSSNQNLSKAI